MTRRLLKKFCAQPPVSLRGLLVWIGRGRYNTSDERTKEESNDLHIGKTSLADLGDRGCGVRHGFIDRPGGVDDLGDVFQSVRELGL